MMQIRKSFLLVLCMLAVLATPITASAATVISRNPLFKPCAAGGCNRERSNTSGSIYCGHHECHAEGCKHRALPGEEYCEQHFFAEK